MIRIDGYLYKLKYFHSFLMAIYLYTQVSKRLLHYFSIQNIQHALKMVELNRIREQLC